MRRGACEAGLCSGAIVVAACSRSQDSSGSCIRQRCRLCADGGIGGSGWEWEACGGSAGHKERQRSRGGLGENLKELIENEGRGGDPFFINPFGG